MNVMAIRLPSVALFSSEVSVAKAFGSPMSISSGGLAMDADRVISLVKTFDGDTEKPKQSFLSSGSTGSALEHSVPEQLFSTPEKPAEGVSAVKALKLANDQGIPIYTINQENINTVLPQLQIDSDDKAEIINAVNAGMVVTTSQSEITYNGWTGVGYIVIDPSTGAGGYMISGGMSGSWLFWVGVAALFIAIVAIGLLICIATPICLLIAAAISSFLTALNAFLTFLYTWAVSLSFFLSQYPFYIFAAIIVGTATACINATPPTTPSSDFIPCLVATITAFLSYLSFKNWGKK